MDCDGLKMGSEGSEGSESQKNEIVDKNDGFSRSQSRNDEGVDEDVCINVPEQMSIGGEDD